MTLRMQCRCARYNAFFKLRVETIERFFGAAPSSAFHQQYRNQGALQDEKRNDPDDLSLI